MIFNYNLTITVILLITVQFGIRSSLSAPVSNKDQTLTPEEKYLVEYGYLSPNFHHYKENWKDELRLSVMAFQAYASITVTGEMDKETSEMMQLPRCGNADIDPYTTSLEMRIRAVDSKSDEKIAKKVILSKQRQKRYVLEGSRWKTRNLFYNISKYPSAMSKTEVDREIQSAFSLWERPTNLIFHRADESSAKIHIDIRFEKLEHGDGDDFDGRGSITAHAFFPRSKLRGQIHFDDDEEWTCCGNAPWGTNLFQVATHEIGHTLGLNHSDVHDSVMAPLYFHFQPDFQLHKDDINGIQALYGKKTTDLCEDSAIDAITTMVDGFTYIFKGPYVYQMDLRHRKLSEGYPKAISFEFPNLPEKGIDAVFTRANNITYFLKDDKVWRFSEMTVDSGFPKMISEFFEGIPSGLNAATTLSADERIYFFKGSQYWKFDHTKTPPVDNREYPKPLSDWKGIPEQGIDAVFRNVDQTHGPTTFFFRNNQFWLFNEQTFSVEVADPPYPLETSLWLYGCQTVIVSPQIRTLKYCPDFSVHMGQFCDSFGMSG